MKILGSWPACGMRYSRNVSGALGYGSALIRVTSRKLNFVPPPHPHLPFFMAKKVNFSQG